MHKKKLSWEHKCNKKVTKQSHYNNEINDYLKKQQAQTKYKFQHFKP